MYSLHGLLNLWQPLKASLHTVLHPARAFLTLVMHANLQGSEDDDITAEVAEEEGTDIQGIPWSRLQFTRWGCLQCKSRLTQTGVNMFALHCSTLIGICFLLLCSACRQIMFATQAIRSLGSALSCPDCRQNYRENRLRNWRNVSRCESALSLAASTLRLPLAKSLLVRRTLSHCSSGGPGLSSSRRAITWHVA